MKTNYKDSSGRNGRFNKRQNNNGSGSRRSSGRRSSNHGNGAANISGISAKRNKYLDMAKEALSNGNRVEAENYYQHAEHYSKMLSAATAMKREKDDNQEPSSQYRDQHKTDATQAETNKAYQQDDPVYEAPAEDGTA